MIKELFWKTYRAKFTTVDRKLVFYMFFRGFTWEVVMMAQEEAEKKSKKEKQVFSLEELTRIY